MSRYTQEQHDFIVSIAYGKKYREIADMFNKKYGTNKNRQAIASYCRKYNIDNGITSELTQLKKGHSNGGHLKKLGSERYNFYGDILIKVKHEGKKHECWRLKKDIIWESYYGKKPRFHIVTHLNGDKSDCRMENLVLCTQGEYRSLYQSGYIQSCPELTLSALNYIKLRNLRKDKEYKLKECKNGN